MNHLLRQLAPISESSWELLDEEARERLQGPLAARRLVDFAGPLGWEHSATNLGRVEELAAPDGGGVSALRRRVLPLTELRADFEVSLGELRDGDRGAVDVDLAALDGAAKQIAICENVAVFHGWKEAGIAGIAEASPIAAEPLGESAEDYPRSVASAVEAIRQGGVEGPYGLALGPDEYTRVIETAEHGGYPLWDHLAKILGGPIVWAPGVDRRGRAQPARRRLPLRVGPGPGDRVQPPRPRLGQPLPRGELLLRRRHPRGGRAAQLLSGAGSMRRGGRQELTAASSTSAAPFSPASGSGDLKWRISTFESMPLLAAAREPGRAFGLDLEHPVEGLAEQLGDVVPALLVDDHRGAAEVLVVDLVEGAGAGRLLDVLEDRLEDRAGDARAQRFGQARPFLVAEELAAGGTVEVLGGAAPLLGVDELDAVVFLEHAHVVGDQVEALVELLGEQVGAGDPLVENDQDLYPQRVGERFGDELFDAVLLLFGLRLWHRGVLRSGFQVAAECQL